MNQTGVRESDNDIDDVKFDDVVDKITSSESASTPNSQELQWSRHGGYKLLKTIWLFIRGPKKNSPQTKDSRFKFIAEQLISTLPDNKSDEVAIKTTHELLSQHRTIEDTEARRRLERWACWTIVIYLISVFFLIILNGLSRLFWPNIFKEEGFISDTVMYVILSTTTVNIIGLGLIVLRGHFLANEGKKGAK